MIILPKVKPTVERYVALHELLKENFEELTYGAEIGVTAYLCLESPVKCEG